MKKQADAGWHVLFVVIVCFALLTACAPVAAPTAGDAVIGGEVIELTLITGPWWNGITGKEDPATATQEDWWKFMGEEYKKINPNVSLKLEIVPWGDLTQKMNVAVSTQSWPDLFIHATSEVVKYAEQGVVEPIDDYLAKAGDDVNDFFPTALEQSSLGGKTYCWPWNGYGTLLVINRAIFKERGIEDLLPGADGQWTYEQFLAAAKATTFDRDGDGTTDVYGFGMGFKENSGDYQRYSFLQGMGASLFGADGKSYGFDSPEAIQGLQFLADLEHQEQAMLPGSASLGWSDIDDAFVQKRVAMIMGAQWWNKGRVDQLLAQGTIKEGDLDIYPALPPRAEGIDPKRTYAGVDCVGVMLQKDAAKREAAMAFAQWFTNAENQHWNTAAAYLPVRKSAANMYSDDPFMAWLSTYAFEYAHPDGVHPALYDTRTVLTPALQEVMSQQKSAEQALTEVRPQIEEIIAKYAK
jgi:multiple sugar transport system substrate-binding protein